MKREAKVKLDLRRLLGFRLYAGTIGSAKTGAKIGQKVGLIKRPKIGSKIGTPKQR